MTPPAHLDWRDPAAIRRWIDRVHATLDDIHGVATDMLLPPRERELGHAQHTRIYHDGHRALLELLEYATPPEASQPH